MTTQSTNNTEKKGESPSPVTGDTVAGNLPPIVSQSAEGAAVTVDSVSEDIFADFVKANPDPAKVTTQHRVTSTDCLKWEHGFSNAKATAVVKQVEEKLQEFDFVTATPTMPMDTVIIQKVLVVLPEDVDPGQYNY